MEMRFTDRAYPELPGFGQFFSGRFARRQVVGSLADACACLVSGFSEQQFGSASAHVGKQRRCLRYVEQRQAEGPAAMGAATLLRRNCCCATSPGPRVSPQSLDSLDRQPVRR